MFNEAKFGEILLPSSGNINDYVTHIKGNMRTWTEKYPNFKKPPLPGKVSDFVPVHNLLMQLFHIPNHKMCWSKKIL